MFLINAFIFNYKSKHICCKNSDYISVQIKSGRLYFHTLEVTTVKSLIYIFSDLFLGLYKYMI